MAALAWSDAFGNPGGLCTGEDSHACVCGQCPVSGSNSARLQPGHRFSANLSSERMAKLDLEQAPAQTFLVARRTYPPAEPTYVASSHFASDRPWSDKILHRVHKVKPLKD